MPDTYYQYCSSAVLVSGNNILDWDWLIIKSVDSKRLDLVLISKIKENSVFAEVIT